MNKFTNFDKVITRGDTFCVATTHAEFMVSILKKYNDNISGVVNKGGEFEKNLYTLIKTFELIARGDGLWNFTEEEKEYVDNGLGLFKEMYFNLWW